MIGDPDTVTCPWCAGLGRIPCCRCLGTRVVTFAARKLAWAWNRTGCRCDTCRYLQQQRAA